MLALLLSQLLWTFRLGSRCTWLTRLTVSTSWQTSSTTYNLWLNNFSIFLQIIEVWVNVSARQDAHSLDSAALFMEAQCARRHAARCSSRRIFSTRVFPSMQPKHLNTWPTGTVKLDLQSALANTRRCYRYSEVGCIVEFQIWSHCHGSTHTSLVRVFPHKSGYSFLSYMEPWHTVWHLHAEHAKIKSFLFMSVLFYPAGHNFR